MNAENDPIGAVSTISCPGDRRREYHDRDTFHEVDARLDAATGWCAYALVGELDPDTVLENLVVLLGVTQLRVKALT